MDRGTNLSTGEFQCQCLEGFVATNFQGVVGVNSDSRPHNRLEASFDGVVKIEIPIACRMFSAFRITLQPSFRRVFRADAFHNPPRLVQGISEADHILDLISAGEWTAI